MGGSIGFYPNTDPETHGSVFCFSIKMTKELSAEKTVAAGGERGEGGNVAPALTTASAPDAHKILTEEIAPSKRLLLAEDNPTNQKLITRILKGLGFETVDIAQDGAQAVQLCAKRPLQYDLILMDVSLPVLDGIAATKEIRKAGLMQIPIIALAANTIKSDMDQFLVQGMNDFVSRPVRRDMLADVLLKWLK
jgi:osomolarity two-component system sensor histidine kinase TcsA